MNLSVPSFMLGFVGRTALVLVAIGLLVLSVSACTEPAGGREELVVFAAASLRDVLTELAESFAFMHDLDLVFNFAGSNVLALQIEASPVADVYIAANDDWMDYLEDRDLLTPGSRRTFLANQLAVIANIGSRLEIEELEDLASLDFSHLSLADPRAVPAGRYAKELFEKLEVDGVTVWSRLEHKVAPAPDVRAALAIVAARSDALGLVYVTDARSSDRVRILAVVAEPLSPSIRYSAAILRGRSSRAAEFLDYLTGEDAGSVFEAHGFLRRSTDG